MYADASGSLGWCAWAAVGGEVLMVEGRWSDAERALDIGEKELFASTAGLAALAAPAQLRSVVSFTDSMVALSAMRTCAPGTARLQALVAARVEWMRAHGMREAAERVGSRSNLWADLGSRGKSEEVVRQAAALGWSVRRVPAAEDWATPEWLLSVPAC